MFVKASNAKQKFNWKTQIENVWNVYFHKEIFGLYALCGEIYASFKTVKILEKKTKKIV